MLRKPLKTQNGGVTWEAATNIERATLFPTYSREEKNAIRDKLWASSFGLKRNIFFMQFQERFLMYFVIANIFIRFFLAIL